MFRFIGMILGKAIIERTTIPVRFDKFFYKFLLNQSPHISDIDFIDPKLAKQLRKMETEDVDNWGLTFSYGVE